MEFPEEDEFPWAFSGSVAAEIIVVFKHSVVNVGRDPFVELVNNLGINNIYKVIHG